MMGDMDELRAKRLKNAFENPNSGAGEVLPPDNVALFRIGDRTRKAEAYWQINRLIETKRVTTKHEFKEVINNLFMVDNGRYALTSSTDNSIRMTNLVTRDERFRIKNTHRNSSPNKLLLTSSGLVISCGKNGEIRMFEQLMGRHRGAFWAHGGEIHGI